MGAIISETLKKSRKYVGRLSVVSKTKDLSVIFCREPLKCSYEQTKTYDFQDEYW